LALQALSNTGLGTSVTVGVIQGGTHECPVRSRIDSID
jgi:hypothetical protein